MVSAVDPPKSSVSSSLLPQTTTTFMRAAQAKDYGDIDAMLSVQEDIAIPRLATLTTGKKEAKNQMVVRTHAVSLARGDVRVLSGKTKELQGPPELPYIPAGDCCGLVVELPETTTALPFGIGDRVAVRFHNKNYGALAEYALVSPTVATKVPDNVSSIDAAALASAAPAYVLAEWIQPPLLPSNHDAKQQQPPPARVLILGAGGGVGSHLCQLLRWRLPSCFIVGVSAAPDRLVQPPLACDAAIDYTKENVFERADYRQQPFDVIYDLAGGGYQQLEDCMRQNQPLIVKTGAQGGRFITTVPPIGPTFEGHSIWGLLQVFLFPILWKAMTSRVWYRKELPTYSFAFALPGDREHLTKMLDLASSGKLKAVVDPAGPFPFTTEGVRAAFRVQESGHGHGKVIIQVADTKK